MHWLIWLLLASGAERLPLVVVDPGHGGQQAGAVGTCGALEKDITLSVSTELSRILGASGRVRSLMTRHGDVTLALEERSRIANAADASLFISVHANASTNPQSNGVETFFLSRRASDKRIRELAERENLGLALPAPSADDALSRILDGLLLNASHLASQRLAMRVQSSLDNALASRARGVLQAPFIVLLGAQMPAVLVEIGFLTNPEECALLSDQAYQRSVARTLAAAVLEHVVNDSVASARH